MKTIKLTRGCFALVDDEDFEMLNLVKWCSHNSRGKNYAFSRKLGLMHRHLIPVTKPYEIDHVDGNGINNQKSNLRICTHHQNVMSRIKKDNHASKYKGVSWHPVNKYWVSRIGFNDKRIHLGVFENEQDAARAYDKAAVEKFGEYAKLNFEGVES